MDNRNEVLRKNLGLMYQAQMAALVCMVLAFIPLVNLIAVLVAGVAAVISVVALVKLRNVHSDYMNAIAALVLAFLCELFSGGEGLFASVMSAANSIAGLFQTYFIIRATNSLLGEIGCDEVIALGNKAWKYTLISSVIAIVCTFLAIVLAPLALVILLVALVLSIVAMVCYMAYLKRSSQSF